MTAVLEKIRSSKQHPREILAAKFIFSTAAGWKLKALPKHSSFAVVFQ